MTLLFAALLQLAPLERLDRAVETGIAEGVYPGAVVVVGTRDTILTARGYGRFTWQSTAAVPDPGGTLVDLASLTKVVATTTTTALLVEAGRLDLERPVQDYLPGFIGAGKEAVTVRHLLEHRSGLRAFLPLHELTSTSADARARVLDEPLRWPPGDRVVYSDLNAMLLGWVIEAATGEPLDVIAARTVFEPLGMSETRFRPAADTRGRTLPVGRWRGHPIAGEIHDQNAARLGGVSGHAGLYATGTDLARFAQWWLGASGPALDPERRARFTARGAGGRGLGWELRDTTSTDNTGQFLSAATFGHTGYTGTSLWIDPTLDLFVVLLTNRVYAPRTGRSISGLKAVRGAVADAAVALRASCRAAGRC